MLLDDVVTNLLLRWEENPSLTPEELCREYADHPEHPALLEAIKNGMRQVRAADSFLDTSEDDKGHSRATPTASEADSNASPQATWNAPGLRYRPLSFHAKGGLGEVFRAEDKELKRDVALKRMNDGIARSADNRRRFLREAEITGRLEHPGIVPVYGLVQDENSEPCYAMRFIEGESLKDAIDKFHQADNTKRDPAERSLALRQLLGRFVALCNTVAFAHNRGIIHRDIKPANIMLGKYGETLLVDWGLARPFGRTEVERSSGENTVRLKGDSADGETRMGHIVGTPIYMSPEQAAGRLDVLGPASDIYSLGATLYTLLCGEASVVGDNDYDIMQKVQRGAFRSPRQIKPSVPRPVEAICLKAMALQPDDRYRSALHLAEDIEHWLADEPVTAYRETFLARLGRWSRRHRPLVVGAAALLLTATVALGVSTAVISREKTATEEAEKKARQAAITAEEAEKAAKAAALEAQEAQRKAQLDAARATKTSEVLAQLFRAADPIGFHGGVAASRKAQTLTAREILDKGVASIQEELKDEPAILAPLLGTIGDTYRSMVLFDKAEPLLNQALELAKKAYNDDDPQMANILFYIAWLDHDLGRYDKAEDLYLRALSIRRGHLGDGHPLVTVSMFQLAWLMTDQQKYNSAEKIFREVVTRRRQAPVDERNLAIALIGLTAMLIDAGRETEAVTPGLEAMQLLSKQKDLEEWPKAVMHFQAGVYARAIAS